MCARACVCVRVYYSHLEACTSLGDDTPPQISSPLRSTGIHALPPSPPAFTPLPPPHCMFAGRARAPPARLSTRHDPSEAAVARLRQSALAATPTPKLELLQPVVVRQVVRTFLFSFIFCCSRGGAVATVRAGGDAHTEAGAATARGCAPGSSHFPV